MGAIVKIPLSELRKGMIVVKFDKGGFSYPHYGHPFPGGSLIQYLSHNGVCNAYIREQEEKTDTDNVILSVLNDNVQINAPTIKELAKVSTVHKKATVAATHILEEARFGKVVDTNKAKGIVTNLVEHCLRAPEAFVSMTHLKDYDNYTYTHSVNVAVLAIAIGRRLGSNDKELNDLGLAGLLHDIGKMMIPERIINKPSKLTDDEFEIIKKHPDYGYRYLQKDKNITDEILFAVRHHHEKADGSGYPSGLNDRQIPKFAKIISIADVYDAITTERSYHKGMVPSDALKLIFSWSGKHFNDSLVKFFISIMGIYPISTLVVLNSNELAIILESNKKDPMRPKVLIISNIKMEPIRPYLFDLKTYNSVTGLPYKSIISSLDPKDFSIDTNRIIEQYAILLRQEQEANLTPG